MDPHLIPGEAAALREQEMAEALSDLANDEFEAGLLSGEFEEALDPHMDSLLLDELHRRLQAKHENDWPGFVAFLSEHFPETCEAVRTKVVADRIEVLKER